MWRLCWSENRKAEVNTGRELDELLDDLHMNAASGNPLVVEIESEESGESISIGLGRSLTVLNSVPASHDPPYHISVGGKRGTDTLVFDYMGEPTEYLIRNCVPIEDGRQAVREYLESGLLPSSVQWEEV